MCLTCQLHHSMGDTTLRSKVKAGMMKIDDVCLFSHVSCEVQCERQVHYEKNVGAEAKAARSPSVSGLLQHIFFNTPQPKKKVADDKRRPVEKRIISSAMASCMSQRHCALARKRNGLRVLTENQIWATAEEVWEKLESCKIASAYTCIQAHRIAKKVINEEGGNSFLGVGGSPHVGSRKDFFPCREGSGKACDGRRIAAPTGQVLRCQGQLSSLHVEWIYNHM